MHERESPLDRMKSLLRSGRVSMARMKLAALLGHEDALLLFPDETPWNWVLDTARVEAFMQLSKRERIYTALSFAEETLSLYNLLPSPVMDCLEMGWQCFDLSEDTPPKEALSLKLQASFSAVRVRDFWPHGSEVNQSLAQSVAYAVLAASEVDDRVVGSSEDSIGVNASSVCRFAAAAFVHHNTIQTLRSQADGPTDKREHVIVVMDRYLKAEYRKQMRFVAEIMLGDRVCSREASK